MTHLVIGVLVTRQVQGWQTEDEGEEEHIEPRFRGDVDILAAAELPVLTHVVAERVARGYVRP